MIVTRPDTRGLSCYQIKQHVDRSCRILLSQIKAVSVTRDSNCKRKTQTRVPSYPYHRQPCRNSNNILKSTRIRLLAIWDEDRLGNLVGSRESFPFFFLSWTRLTQPLLQDMNGIEHFLIPWNSQFFPRNLYLSYKFSTEAIWLVHLFLFPFTLDKRYLL